MLNRTGLLIVQRNAFAVCMPIEIRLLVGPQVEYTQGKLAAIVRSANRVK